VLEGRSDTLVRDGAIELDTMKRAGISRERLFALLRNQQVLQLGEVKRAYLEAGGQLSVYRDSEPRAGLCLLPGTDRDAYEDQFSDGGQCACRSCGNLVDDDHANGACPICHDDQWAPAARSAPLRELRDDRAEQRAAH
jgi:hypothetical protein